MISAKRVWWVPWWLLYRLSLLEKKQKTNEKYMYLMYLEEISAIVMTNVGSGVRITTSAGQCMLKGDLEPVRLVLELYGNLGSVKVLSLFNNWILDIGLNFWLILKSQMFLVQRSTCPWPPWSRWCQCWRSHVMSNQRSFGASNVKMSELLTFLEKCFHIVRRFFGVVSALIPNKCLVWKR